jgi:type I site-specific restriction-modification system R (restriction) subunit
VDGVTVEYQRPDGSIAGAQVRLIDFATPANNDFLAVNQFRVEEAKHKRRPDVVLFINGLPLVVIELKNPADENATVWSAFQQLQTYKAELPTLFAYNALLVVSDGVQARIGTLTAGKEWFKPWRTISGAALAESSLPELHVLIAGVLDRRRNDLDDQLFGTFALCKDLCASRRCRLRAAPTCARSCGSRPAAWCSPTSRSSCRRRRATATRCSPTAATSW